MENAFEARATRAVQQRPKSAGAIRRPVRSLVEMRSREAGDRCGGLLFHLSPVCSINTHAASLSALADIRKRTAEKLRGKRAFGSTANSNMSTSRSKASLPTSTPASSNSGIPRSERASRRSTGPPAVADRPAAGIQRPKSAGVVRRSPKPAVDSSIQIHLLSRREQIALKKQQDSALDIRNRKSPRPTARRSSVDDSDSKRKSAVAPPVIESPRRQPQPRPKSAAGLRRSARCGEPRVPASTAGATQRVPPGISVSVSASGNVPHAKPGPVQRHEAQGTTDETQVSTVVVPIKAAANDDASAEGAEERGQTVKPVGNVVEVDKLAEAQVNTEVDAQEAGETAEAAADEPVVKAVDVPRSPEPEITTAKVATHAEKVMQADDDKPEEERENLAPASPEKVYGKDGAELELVYDEESDENEEQAVPEPAAPSAESDENIGEPATEPSESSAPSCSDEVKRESDKTDNPTSNVPDETPEEDSNEEPKEATKPDVNSRTDDVIGHLITKDLDPRKAELLRQAQQRVLEKRKALGTSAGPQATAANSTSSPAPAAGAKPTWQQKLDAALARRRADGSSKSGTSSGDEASMDQRINETIDNRIKSLKAQKQNAEEAGS